MLNICFKYAWLVVQENHCFCLMWNEAWSIDEFVDWIFWLWQFRLENCLKKELSLAFGKKSNLFIEISLYFINQELESYSWFEHCDILWSGVFEKVTHKPSKSCAFGKLLNIFLFFVFFCWKYYVVICLDMDLKNL